MKIEVCCKEMIKKLVGHNEWYVQTTSGYKLSDYSETLVYPDKEINFCPFCGAAIEIKEAEHGKE